MGAANAVPDEQRNKFDGMDGIGIFWNKAKFTEVYGPRRILLPNCKNIKYDEEKITTVNGWGKQVAMWMLLRNNVTQRTYAVISFHGKSGKETDGDVELQAKLTQAEWIAEIIKEEIGENMPLICGFDFNNNTESKTYRLFRQQLPFIGEAYEDLYGKSPSWGSSKWRSSGSQPDKIGYTPNDIDFVFYNKRFLKTRAVWAYPACADNSVQLEECNLPGLKYPSDHFAHMAVFEELPTGQDLQQVQFEELYHLIKRDYITGGQLPKWFGTSQMPVVEFSAVAKTLGEYRSVGTACKNNTLSEVEKQQCKCLECTYKTEEGQTSVMDGLQELYKADEPQNYERYEECVLRQMRQLDALDAQKQQMMKEHVFYRSYVLLKYAILNKVARLNSTSDTLMKFIKETFTEINGQIDATFKDDQMKAESEKQRVGKLKMYKKFGIFPITLEELEEHLTNARVLWLQKHLSKTKARGAPRDEAAIAESHFQGWWPDTNDEKYNIGYDPTVEELQELARELNETCAGCRDLPMPKDNVDVQGILKHHDEGHRHVKTEMKDQESTGQSGPTTPSLPQLAPVYDFQCDIANSCMEVNATPKWSSYKSEHSAEIYANCSKGPVRLTIDPYGTFVIGLMQVSLSVAGYGCVRPVRMVEESKFECDINGRCGSQRTTSPDWQPYNDAAILSLENLSKGPVEISNNHGTFMVGFMQLGIKGPGRGHTRPVRALNLHSKPDPMHNTPEQHQSSEPRKQFEEKTEPTVDRMPSHEKRRLVDTARMEAKDVDAMSPSELVLRRRRLAHGVRTPPVLAALMDEIEEAKRKYQLYYL